MPISIHQNIVPPIVPNVAHLKEFFNKQYGSLYRNKLHFYTNKSLQIITPLDIPFPPMCYN